MLSGVVVDADSHVLEPRDLWTSYLEPEYRARAIRIEEHGGVESLVIADVPVLTGSLAGLGGSHLDPMTAFTSGLKYEDGNPPASYDPHARVALYDAEGITAGVVFPTIGILPVPSEDEDLKSAYCRAYNRWQADFASVAPDRILPIASLNFGDAEEAARELDTCLAAGFRGVFLPPEPVGQRRPGDAVFDPIWRRCAEAGIPVCMHVIVRFSGGGVPFQAWAETSPGLLFGFALTAPGQLIPTLSTMVLDGVFDRHPSLKVVCVEAGCGWAPFVMDRLDDKQRRLGGLVAEPLKERPSDYLKRNVWYVAEPHERTIPSVVDLVGADHVLWGSDFPHIDADVNANASILQALARLSEDARTKVLGTTAASLFGCVQHL
ncbi:MAG TPA: amidohydrolase family protein [Acidimicrobiales bacterium]|nr:amidohydrolase family protein [Acidimicrobiales bacterium]